MSYEDMKIIEAAQFAKSVVEGTQGEPGLAEADRVAQVLAAFDRSVDIGGVGDGGSRPRPGMSGRQESGACR